VDARAVEIGSGIEICQFPFERIALLPQAILGLTFMLEQPAANAKAGLENVLDGRHDQIKALEERPRTSSGHKNRRIQAREGDFVEEFGHFRT
jgi:hypothetical protein